MPTLRERYREGIIPQLMRDLGVDNPMAVPHVEKIVVNVGVNAGGGDAKLSEAVERSIVRITGQRPVRTLARQSIASFKIRSGMAVGTMATLRGQRMWDFLEKLIRVTLPRVRDFRGLSPRAVDQGGNLSIGFHEHVAFPEIRTDEVEAIHGVQVTVVSTARNRDRGLALFRALGFPFRQQ